jgi:hypothetical protein
MGQLNMIDVTDRMIAAYNAGGTEETIDKRTIRVIASTSPVATVTFAKLADYRSHEIARKPQGFDDIDEALNFQALVACLTNYVDDATEQSPNPPERPDHELQHLYYQKLMDVLNLHQRACVKNGLWRIYYDVEKDTFHARLTRRRRQSALLALNMAAQADLLNHLHKNQLSNNQLSDDDVYFALASSAEHLRFVEQSTHQSWLAFTAATGFTSHELTNYVGFLVFLSFAAQTVGHPRLYAEDFLRTLRKLFVDAFGLADFSDEVMLRLMNLFSLTPKEAQEYSLPVPFFRMGNRYLRYNGFLRIMSPAMGLLTIVIRKHEASWSKTLGSTLAHAADSVAASLPSYPDVAIAVRRSFGSGDVDLGLYDITRRHLLICEVKTVYDKHRTTYQMHRFEQAKVNMQRAVDQLARTTAVLNSGALSMETIFGRKLPAPLHIDKALLTWLDPVDLTMDTPYEDVLSLNFATLRYLYQRCNGNITSMVRCIKELRNIWCLAVRRPLDLGQPTVNSYLEVQVPKLDSDKDLASLGLSTVTLHELRRLSEAWTTLGEPAANEYVSYLDESRKSLANTVMTGD